MWWCGDTRAGALRVSLKNSRLNIVNESVIVYNVTDKFELNDLELFSG